MKEVIEDVLRNRVLDITDEYRGEKREDGVQVYLGYPQQLIDELYDALFKLEQNKRKIFNKLHRDFRHDKGKCIHCGNKLDGKSTWRCKKCLVKARGYVKKSREKLD